METLQNLVHGYLVSADYNFLETREGFLVADKLVLGGARDTRLVWIVPTLLIDDEDLPQLERRLLREFTDRISQYPNASRWLVTHMRGEFSKGFQSEMTRLGFEQRAEIEFFDAPFKVDENPRHASAIHSLRDPAIRQRRVPQPYSVLADGEPQERGDDLLDLLLDELRDPQESCLRIVVGPAGAGKTVLFKALFSRLYEHFSERKQRLEVFPRPIPLIPDYLRQTTALRVQQLVDSFINTDVAVSISRSTFEWMVTHGYAMWLFDGLDELYAQDEQFFDILTNLLTYPPESQAQVLVCARESLLTSCERFVEFLNEFPPGQEPAIRLYRLDDWDRPSKRAFAWLHFEGYIPAKKKQKDPRRVSQFLTYVSRSDSLKSLSSLPYYCDLLLKEFERGNPVEFSDDFALVAHAVSEIIKREVDKGLLSMEHLQSEGLAEWLETVACESYANNFKGINKEDVETYASLVLRPELSEEERRNTITTLVQFPIFAPGLESGIVAFEHELIAEYLTARYWLYRITDDPGRVAHELGTRIDFADSLIGRYMANRLPRQSGGIQAIVDALRREALSGRAFANLLQLLLLTTPARDILKSHRITVESRDLSHMQFMHRDLRGFSFRNCNLSNTIFRDCNLQNAKFEGAYLIGTRF